MRLFGFILALTLSVSAAHADDFEAWLEWQHAIAENKILANISPQNARRGAVIASPSAYDPPYYYHWVRDAALVMDVWMRQLEGSSKVTQPKQRLESMLWDFVDFTSFSQGLADSVGVVGLGEPRYYVDGTPNLEPWGRPQNDGPALRASLFIRFAEYLVETGREGLARQKLWPVIKRDLKYTGDQVYAVSVDLWEEVRGDHFYTRVACRAALLLGSDIAVRFGEHGLAAWYATQAGIAESLAFGHFDHTRQQIIENTHREDWSRDKSSGLDASTLLALLHTVQKPIVVLTHPMLVKTLNKLQQRFQDIYRINHMFTDLGVAIGRYPEDHYYGGNPWFLTTFAYAEYYYRLGDRHTGDQFMKRARFHAGRDGHLAEQMSRDYGYMVSAADLTWSYAAFITAYEARRNFTSKKR